MPQHDEKNSRNEQVGRSNRLPGSNDTNALRLSEDGRFSFLITW
jgi:hypothetical protein